jgi:hypothetical protein
MAPSRTVWLLEDDNYAGTPPGCDCAHNDLCGVGNMYCNCKDSRLGKTGCYDADGNFLGGVPRKVKPAPWFALIDEIEGFKVRLKPVGKWVTFKRDKSLRVSGIAVDRKGRRHAVLFNVDDARTKARRVSGLRVYKEQKGTVMTRIATSGVK